MKIEKKKNKLLTFISITQYRAYIIFKNNIFVIE